jgi:hypothetical protein
MVWQDGDEDREVPHFSIDEDGDESPSPVLMEAGPSLQHP